MSKTVTFLDRPIEYLKGVGPVKAALLGSEMNITTFKDLLYHFPFRYVDKTKFQNIREISEDSGEVQIRGVLRRLTVVGEGRKRRLIGRIRAKSGTIDLIWFKGIHYLENQLLIGCEYIVYGRVNAFNNRLNIPHPEIDLVSLDNQQPAASFAPVYPSTEKLISKGLDMKARRRLMKTLLEKLKPEDLTEHLPAYLIKKFRFVNLFDALQAIHFPKDEKELKKAQDRLKFEELFFLQLRLLRLKAKRRNALKGHVFATVGDHFNTFYHDKLPFELTGAQKRVVKEIRLDLKQGIQMNRLLQGDVGSGKTVVGLMCMLMALDNGFQACLMAPTEILAQQHYHSIQEYLKGMDIQVSFVSGSIGSRTKKRKKILERLAAGEIDILIGTHALIEDPVQFKNLGIAIIDEQHRFGVKQRAKLWRKSKPFPPHVLVMTATPIPRTLAMTLYGDLDVSVIDELPPGRKEIRTVHKNDNHRLRVMGFIRSEIAKGRQVYIVYPLIEESETLDLKNLEEGYEAISREFPLPDYKVSIVHGRMKTADKDFEMQRFVKGETQIMVATTVIEVGVNVPNASVMIIENTERFGLSQLHQLRGRVGRGAEQSYCILMTGFKLSHEGRERIQTMCRTNNGFEIAEADLRLRGPGNLEGTQQSGLLQLRLADLAKDTNILKTAREVATRILEDDPLLEKPHHAALKAYLTQYERRFKSWSRIS